MFPVRDMKRCYLQKKICVTIWDFKKGLSGYYMVLACGINVYEEKSSLASIFK